MMSSFLFAGNFDDGTDYLQTMIFREDGEIMFHTLVFRENGEVMYHTDDYLYEDSLLKKNYEYKEVE